jgi:hypothetical protein
MPNLQSERFWQVNMVSALESVGDMRLSLLAVVVEKPFTKDTADADRVIAVAKKSEKILTVFQSALLPT